MDERELSSHYQLSLRHKPSQYPNGIRALDLPLVVGVVILLHQILASLLVPSNRIRLNRQLALDLVLSSLYSLLSNPKDSASTRTDQIHFNRVILPLETAASQQDFKEVSLIYNPQLRLYQPGRHHLLVHLAATVVRTRVVLPDRMICLETLRQQTFQSQCSASYRRIYRQSNPNHPSI